MTEAEYELLKMKSKEQYEVVRTYIEDEEKDKESIKKIRKAIKKILHDASVSDIVSYTNYGRPKVLRLLKQYDSIYWQSEKSFGRVGKPTNVYKRIKNVKN